MSIFFKAWAAYSGILVKLAPPPLQADHATALSMYTMNLYDLLEKYAWEDVKAYHFQFHRKCVASGKSIYYGTEWHQLDSEPITSKCFAHPAPRPTWTPNPKLATAPTRRISKLPIRESIAGPTYPPISSGTVAPYTPLEYRIQYSQQNVPAAQNQRANTGTIVPTLQVCRNWNYRECRSI